MKNTELATWLHDNYEGLAKAFQWETQKETRVPFEELPIKNKNYRDWETLAKFRLTMK